MYTLTNATIIDGTGQPRYAGDLIVGNGKIKAVGTDLGAAGEVVDVAGRVVCPGFIDMHTHSQLVAFVDPGLPAKVAQGITTELFGQDGLGAYPMIPTAVEGWRTHLSGLDCNPAIDWNWQNAGSYLSRLPRPAANIASLAGHGNIRLCVMGMANRPATGDELWVMGELLRQSLKEGAFGLSTGLIYAPCVFADTRELICLNRIVAEFGGIFVTHMRNEGTYIWQALEEVFQISRESGVHLHISHLKLSGRESWGQASTLIERIEHARAQGLKITADQYPYTAASTMLSAILPSWVHTEGLEGLRRVLRDPTALGQIRDEMERGVAGKRSIVKETGYERIMVSSVDSGRYRDFEGKTLVQIGNFWNVSPFEAAVRLLLDEDFAVGMITFSIGEDDVREILTAPWRAMGTDGLLGGKPHPRAYGSVPRILGHYSRDLGILSLEEAVRKMTSLPASILGLRNRGTLMTGSAADLVVFDPATVRDPADYDNPRQFPVGMPYVFVNGRPVVWQGKLTNERPGEILRR